jgi:mRNA-degrading endonuclease RelE of RelBE toxin-antitoxin system
MKILLSNKAEKAFDKLPVKIKKKALKQFNFLDIDINHPSLRIKRLLGTKYFEGRIDYHYRFIFQIENNVIQILAIGPHDSGLGKK